METTELHRQLISYIEFFYELGEESILFFNKSFPLSQSQNANTKKTIDGTQKIITKNETKTIQNIKQSTSTTFEELITEINQIDSCKLKQFATNTVIYEGVTQNPDYFIIGEAPGEEEDLSGKPFVGKSGKLLEKALNSVGIFRTKNALITNNIFWRPPANRKPNDEELSSCKPYINKMIQITKPKKIILVGGVSIQNFLETDEGITKLRGKKFSYLNIPTYAIFHPSYLLRSPAKKKDTYLDLLNITFE